MTGSLTDVGAVARMLHGAGRACLLRLRGRRPVRAHRHAPADPAERIDALFLSTHKFMGGPEASGVLVAHRDLFRSRTPERPGGGTVDYVSGCRPTTSTTSTASTSARRAGRRRSSATSGRASPSRQGQWAPPAILEHEVELAGRAPRASPGTRGSGLRPARRAAPAHPLLQRRGSAPRPRLGAPRPPLRHPEPRRLLLRRAVRPSPARDRPGELSERYRRLIAAGSSA